MIEEPTYTETYVGIRRTPDLVGRQTEREKVAEAIGPGEQPSIVYITAPGGIGKTRFLEDLLKNPPGNIPLNPASRPVDLYHTRFHTLSGLVYELLDVLKIQHGKSNKDHKNRIEETAKLEGIGLPLNDASRKKLTQWVLNKFNTQSAKQPILLAFDTLERTRLVDPVQDMLGLVEQRATILDWLLEDFLPGIKNAVIVLAGRPEPMPENDRLKRELAKTFGHQFTHLELKGLTEVEALIYFQKVINQIKEGGNSKEQQAIGTLDRLSEAERRAVFYCLCDETVEAGYSYRIRPILLALAIDHLIVSGRTLPALLMPLEEARKLTPDQRQAIRNDLNQALVQNLRENYRYADEIILALAWLRKGANENLLAQIVGYDLNNAKELTKVEQTIEQIKDLSFIKVRTPIGQKGDKQLFLHDEMYDMLKEFALDRLPGWRQEKVYTRLKQYYEGNKEKGLKGRIKEGWDSLEELNQQDRVDSLTKLDAYADWQGLLAENVYYQLQWNPVEGFDTYFSYAEEAVGARNINLDMQLKAELLDFYSYLSDEEAMDSLRRADILAEFALRWIKRLIMEEQNDEARQVIKQLRTSHQELIPDDNALVRLELDIWEGYLLTLAGGTENLSQAKGLLDWAIEKLQDRLEHGSVSKQLSAIMARAYTFLGQYHRVGEKYRPASDAYNKAIAFWRYTYIRSELADVYNRRAFVLGLLGYFSVARRQAWDALLLRKKQGLRGPEILSLNTLATINIKAGSYNEAEDFASAALYLAREIDYKFAEGLAQLALTAIHRFQSEQTDLIVEEGKDLLQQAVKASEAALTIFTEIGPMPEYEAEAYYSRGSAYRELYRISQNEADFKQAESDFLQARAKNEGRPVAGLEDNTGLAWTYYYANQNEKLQDLIVNIEQVMSGKEFAEYVIKPGYVPDKNEGRSVRVFGRLARFHVLKGTLAMKAFEDTEEPACQDHLKRSAHEFMMALEYNRYIEENTQELQRAIDNIIEHTKRLKTEELKIFFDEVRTTYNALRLGEASNSKLWKELEEHFGPYEMIGRLDQK